MPIKRQRNKKRDIISSQRSQLVPAGSEGLTLVVEPSKVRLKIIDRCEKNFHVQDELFRHTYSFQILPVTDLPQHVRNARSAGLLER